MLIRNVDKNWDWTFGNSKSNYVSEGYAIILNVQMRIKEWFGDCFFALQEGIPWQVRLVQHNQKELLDNDLITRIQETEGVLSVVDFSSTTDGRRYQAKCSIYTQYSNNAVPITIDSENIINA